MVQELSECHLLSTGLQPCNLKPIPQRPVYAIILQKTTKSKEWVKLSSFRILFRLKLLNKDLGLSPQCTLKTSVWEGELNSLTSRKTKLPAWCISISMAGSSLELKMFSTVGALFITVWGTKPLKYTHLVFGSSNGFREGKERESQVHEAILEWLQRLVSSDNFDELQTHQAHHCSCGGCDGWNDFARYQFALDRMMFIISVMKREREREENLKKIKMNKQCSFGISPLPYACLWGECHSFLLVGWMLLQWSPCGSWYHHPVKHKVH